MADDDYEPAIGTDSMEEAEIPGQPARAERRGRDDVGHDPDAHWESSRPDTGSLPTVRPKGREGRINHRVKTPEQQKAFDDLVAARKAEKARPLDPDADGDEDDWAPADPREPVTADPPPQSTRERVEARERATEPQDARPQDRAPVARDAPDVALLRQQLAADRDGIAKEREALAKARTEAESVADFERYLDAPDKSTRAWFEHMRGDKLSDDDYRQEVADHITLLSERVLGVKLTDDIKARLDTALTKKALGAYKTTAQRRELAETNKRESERVEHEWREAGRTLTAEFGREDIKTKYGWLAAEDNPGAIVVDVIRAAQKRDGTHLKWDEAAKMADEHIAKDYRSRISKRQHLINKILGAQADSPPRAPAPDRAAERPGRPQEQGMREPSRVPVRPRGEPSLKWDAAAHRKATLNAFKGKLSD